MRGSTASSSRRARAAVAGASGAAALGWAVYSLLRGQLPTSAAAFLLGVLALWSARISYRGGWDEVAVRPFTGVRGCLEGRTVYFLVISAGAGLLSAWFVAFALVNRIDDGGALLIVRLVCATLLAGLAWIMWKNSDPCWQSDELARIAARKARRGRQ